MKFIKKISAGLLITLLSIGNVIAAGIPDEPMVIYGNISGVNSDTLKIYDGNNNLLKEIVINSGGKYGTNKTFSSEKIKLDKFEGELKFKIGTKSANISKGEINVCNTSAIFQKGGICEYNLSFSNSDNSTDDEVDLDKLFENIFTDNITIEEKYRTDNINDIFDGKIFEKETSVVKNTIGENILKNISDNKKVIVTSNKLELAKKVNKKIILINNSKKEAVFIDENTQINESNVIIEKPKRLTNISNIKSKINKVIIGAVEVPTNKQITFKKFIRVCTQLVKNKTKDLKVYYSHDNLTWTLDNNAKNIEIGNGQVCFDVNHLTSFAVGEDENTSSNNSSSSHHSSGGSSHHHYTVKVNNKVIAANSNKQENKTNIDNTNKKTFKNITKPVRNVVKNKVKKIDLNKYDGKKYIYSELKLNSKIYVKNLELFYKNIKIEDNSLSYTIYKIRGDKEYNKIIDYYKKKIILNFKLSPIRESMFRHLNKMTTSYGIYKYNNLDDNLENFYKESFAENMNNFKFKLIRLKQKDEMISKTLERRRKAKLNLE